MEFDLSDGTNSSAVTYPTPVSTGNWIHIAAVLDSDTMKFFINGEEIGEEPFTGTPTQNVTRFSVGNGATKDPSPAYESGMTGFISQVSVWNKGLTQSEIQNLAANGLTGSESDLIAYWKLDDEPESYVVKDYGPNSLDLRLDQNSYRPLWSDTHPLQYPMDAVDSPYFKVTEYDWTEESSNNIGSTQDIYMLNLDNDNFKDAIVTDVDFGNYTEQKVRALKNNGNLTFTDFTDTKLGNVNTIFARFGKVTDFNGDNIDDLMMADTGPDVPPQIGRQNTLLLGNLSGHDG